VQQKDLYLSRELGGIGCRGFHVLTGRERGNGRGGEKEGMRKKRASTWAITPFKARR